jgi:hypothetical protein
MGLSSAMRTDNDRLSGSLGEDSDSILGKGNVELKCSIEILLILGLRGSFDSTLEDGCVPDEGESSSPGNMKRESSVVLLCESRGSLLGEFVLEFDMDLGKRIWLGEVRIGERSGVVDACSKGSSIPKIVPFPSSLFTLI